MDDELIFRKSVLPAKTFLQFKESLCIFCFQKSIKMMKWLSIEGYWVLFFHKQFKMDRS